MKKLPRPVFRSWTFQEVGTEWLVYVSKLQKAYCLDERQFRVLEASTKGCDYESFLAESGWSPESLNEVVEHLVDAGLMVGETIPRRDFLKKGAAVAAIAAVSIPAPLAAASSSTCGTMPFGCPSCPGTFTCAPCSTDTMPPGANCVCMRIRDSNKLAGTCSTDGGLGGNFDMVCVDLNAPQDPRVNTDCAAARAQALTLVANYNAVLCDGSTTFVFNDEYVCCTNCV